MTTPALIKQADLKRMAEIAKTQGVRVEFEVDGKIFRVAPDIPDNHKLGSVDLALVPRSNSLSERRAQRESRLGGRPQSKKEAR